MKLPEEGGRVKMKKASLVPAKVGDADNRTLPESTITEKGEVDECEKDEHLSS